MALFLSQHEFIRDESLCSGIFDTKSDWKSWYVKYLASGNHRRYKKRLVGKRKIVSVDKVPTQAEFEMDEPCSSGQHETIKKAGRLNELAYIDIHLIFTPKLLLE